MADRCPAPPPDPHGGSELPHRRSRVPGNGPLRRTRENQYLAGVCGGVGKRPGIDPTVVRVITMLLVLGAGTGLLVYMAAWLMITRQGEDRSIAKGITSDPSEMRLAMMAGTLSSWVPTRSVSPLRTSPGRWR